MMGDRAILNYSISEIVWRNILRQNLPDFENFSYNAFKYKFDDSSYFEAVRDNEYGTVRIKFIGKHNPENREKIRKVFGNLLENAKKVDFDIAKEEFDEFYEIYKKLFELKKNQRKVDAKEEIDALLKDIKLVLGRYEDDPRAFDDFIYLMKKFTKNLKELDKPKSVFLFNKLRNKFEKELDKRRK